MTKPPIILGGGLAGLSACFHGDGVIYEQKEASGGHARSHSRDGFTFDEGIHVLHTNSEYVLKLLEKTNADLEVKERSAWIVSNGGMTRYPFQANTYGLPANIVRDCLLGFIQNDFTDRDQIKNYEDWIYFMFGQGIAEHFMIPYCKKFWGVDPKMLTTDWVNIRHPRPSLEEVITGALEDQTKGFGINAVFRYPREGGFGRIAQSLADQCEGRIHPGMRATRIDAQRREVEFNGGTVIGYDNILSTIPLPDLVNIIPDASESVREASGKLRTNSIFVVNIGVNRPNITDKTWIYYLGKEYSFVRVSFPFNMARSVAPTGTSSISAEIAYGNDNPLPESPDKIGDRVIADLIRADLLRPDDEIVYLDTIDIKYGYVIYDEDRKPAIETIHEYLKSINIIPCGRYGMWGYLWSDEAILSGKKAAENLAKI
jgi:protoporphyrinogen oxidase